jgi:sortase A
MAPSHNPVIIRQPSMQRWTKPGLHTYNARRRFSALRERISNLSILQLCLVALGLAGVGYYAYTLVDEHVYQSFQNWAFDQGIAGRANVTFVDYLSERTPFGFLIRGNQPDAAQVPVRTETSNGGQRYTVAASIRPAHGALLGRVEISRLHLSAMVREGVDDAILRVAVGHVPATALAGQSGNFAIAAHRDTLFRALKDIRGGDLVTFQSSDGSAYQYRVAATQVIKPSDVSVLRSDGGGLITGGGSVQGMPKLLTMITCYPFSYIGSAPKRFIVEARLVEGEEAPKATTPAIAPDGAAAAPTPQIEEVSPIHKPPAHAVAHRKRGTESRMKYFAGKRAVRTPVVSSTPLKPVKKKGFWRKFFGNS